MIVERDQLVLELLIRVKDHSGTLSLISRSKNRAIWVWFLLVCSAPAFWNEKVQINENTCGRSTTGPVFNTALCSSDPYRSAVGHCYIPGLCYSPTSRYGLRQLESCLNHSKSHKVGLNLYQVHIQIHAVFLLPVCFT